VSPRPEKAAEGDERFRLVVEAAPNAMVLADKDGRIVMVNAEAERLFGYPREELVGRPVEVLVPPRLRAAHPGLRAGFHGSTQARPMGAGRDLYGVRKDGVEIPVEIGLNPLGAEGLVLASIVDISARLKAETERRKARELEEQNRRMAEASRLKNDFLANMSHELRTPLNAVIGFSQLLHDGKAGPLTATQSEFLGDVLESSRHLLQLINDVLDLAKIEAGKMSFAPEPVSLGRLVGEVRDALGALAEKKDLDCRADVDPAVDAVVLDPKRLKQVLYNYLSNAFKFTADGGRVRVRARPEGEAALRLEVEDSGFGIRPEDFRRLFVEFQQLDHPLTKAQPGTGLGLALTKRIVEAQGGRVGVASEPGRGSVFYAVLPRRHEP
jgi:PAS domain S-box-containing protein